ncbi:MAG: choice-of-anchor Q domain-containing protein [Candidatus Cloacimonadota bacterium]|nr:choice-of-anchor Q domain-containing protein [Candidatus Cloacimonadota bacterium]
MLSKRSLYIFIIFYLFVSSLYGEVIVVDICGSGDYPTIQEGINASTDGDTVLVYPGIYYENVDYLEKSLTIGSLNMVTGDSTYIDSTVVDGNQNGSCVYLKNVDEGILYGFTLRNGSGNPYSSVSIGLRSGGGVYSWNSHLDIINCVIKDNEAFGGGGIYSRNSVLFLAGTEITNNHSLYTGNITIWDNSEIYFDEENLCSIYLNYAALGNEITINGFDSLNIVLNKFTVAEPTGESIYMVEGEDYGFSCQESVVEQVEADLYVSTEGDNSNSGLNPGEPLQSITFALLKIKADSLHPHSIYVSDGIYSASQTGESLPLNMRTYVSLIGESEENTIIDGEFEYALIAAWNGEKEMTIKDFTLRNGYWEYSGVQLRFYGHTSVHLENLTIKDCTYGQDENASQFILMPSTTDSNFINTYKNITIIDCFGSYPLYVPPIRTYGENIKVMGTEPLVGGCGGALMSMSNSTNSTQDTSMLVNLQISDNTSYEDEWPNSNIIVLIDNSSIVLINATIGDNECFGNGPATIFIRNGAHLTLINSIVYDNYANYQIHLKENGIPAYGPTGITVRNSLIQGGEDGIYSQGDTEINWLEGNLDTIPYWTQSGEYPYQLQENSPCIDAGTLDLPAGIELPEFDLAGNPRIYGETVDMGAYEWPGYAVGEEPLDKSIKLTSAPNPFRNETVISFQLTQTGIVNLTIYNIKGQFVRTLIDAYSSPGNFQVNWKGVDKHDYPVSNGAYFAKLVVDDKQKAVKRIIKF